VSFIERLTGDEIPVQMNKDEEIKHLSELNERNHFQLVSLKKLLSMTEDSLRHARNTQEELHRQLMAAHEKWNEDKAALSACRNAVKEYAKQRNIEERKNLELENLLYATISMLSEQDADDVLSQLDKIQRRT
jgi:hypothetical protein